MVRTWSRFGIAGQLYLLGAVVFLPVAALIGHGIYADYREAIAEASRNAFRHARNVAEQTERFHQQSFEILQGLARRPAIRAMSTAPCDTVFDHFLAANKSYANLLLDNADGDVICNAAKGPNLKGLVTHRPWFKNLMATGKRQVGDPTVGQVVGRWIVALAEPVLDDDGKVHGALVFTVDLWNYQFYLDRDFKETSFLVTILDSRGAVVARSREPDQWVGKKVQIPSAAIRSVKPGDTASVSDADSIEQLYGHATVPGTDWVVLVSSPKSVVSAEVWEKIKPELTLAGAMIALLFVTALLVAKRIQEPIKAIAHAAEAVGDGRFDVRLPEAGGNRELSILARKFNRMAEQRSAAETRQAQAMADLVQSGERERAKAKELDTVLETVPMAVFIAHDRECRLITGNRAAHELVGVPRGANPSKTAPEGERPTYRTLRDGVEVAAEDLPIHVAAATGTPVFGFPLSIVLDDGTERHAYGHAIPLFDADGKTRGAVGAFVDVTERNRALEQLRLAASVFDNAAEGILITDKDNNIVSVNRAFTEITGYPEQEAIGKNPSLLASGRQAPAFYDEMWASINTTGRWWGEVWDRRKSGESYCEALSICAVRDERGEITNYCAVFEDITQRKIAETKLVELNTELEARVAQRTAELERANMDLEAFSYSVSHDLRAPLRAIGGFAAIVLQQSTLDAESVDLLQRIGAAGERMGRIIDDLLSLARVAQQPLRRQDLDLSALADEVAAALGQAHPERQVDVVVAPGMRIDADPGLAHIVLENLIGNAWKFTSRTGAARIEVGCGERAGETVCFVRDNGAGFDMKYADKLFGPFQRLHSEKEFEGTGIGLSIVQRIVARHGGRLWAEGEVGRGASFYFTLGNAGQSRQPAA